MDGQKVPLKYMIFSFNALRKAYTVDARWKLVIWTEDAGDARMAKQFDQQTSNQDGETCMEMTADSPVYDALMKAEARSLLLISTEWRR